ncbi:MAG: VWA domain-containing protein [Gammaproteobacteria bacterium]|nr:VWA domain-containing protein [Gammaproteobacteria bacterium]
MAQLPTSDAGVARFLAEARRTPPATRSDRRILFALDATASREPTWDLASRLHGELFEAASDDGGTAVQLVHYGGFNEFHASPWTTRPAALLRQMTEVRCRGGLTQIQRVLEHALTETSQARIRAVVFIGDACEEPVDKVADAAGRLALFQTPVFVFQEGADPDASRVFRQVARLTGGAHSPFAPGRAADLRALLKAVAHFAASGRRGVERLDHPAAARLLRQLP